VLANGAFAGEAPSPAVYGVRMERVWIPMKDGVRLAATLYLPDGAKPGEKFPALLDYLPYRKDDGTAAGDYPKNAYFARRGYVGARVEYSEQEQTDGEQLVWSGHLSFRSDAKNFFYKYTRELRRDGQMIKTKTWEEAIPRDVQ
jgi:uncharacterized protein